MRFSLKKFLGLLILIPFLLSGYVYAVAEEGEAEGKEEAAVEVAQQEEAAPEPAEAEPEQKAPEAKEEAPAAAREESGKGFYQKYVKPTDYAISRAFMRLSPLESQRITNFRLFGRQIDSLTESIPGLEIQGMLKNRTWVNTHGRSGYTSGGGDLTGGTFNRMRKSADGTTWRPWDRDNNSKDTRLRLLTNKGRRPSQFNMIEWLSELKVRYSVNPNISFHSIFNFRYDSLYDWDKHVMRAYDQPFTDELKPRNFAIRKDPNNPNSGQRRETVEEARTRAYAMASQRHEWMKAVEKEQSYYRDTKQILRELYADLIFPSPENGTLSFRIGKQQVGLGKQDFNVVDIISQRWGTEGPSSIPGNLEWDRQPTWMFNMAYTFPERILPGVSMKFLWLPDWEPAYPAQRAGAPNWGRGRPPVRSGIVNPRRVIRARNGLELGPASGVSLGGRAVLTHEEFNRGVRTASVSDVDPWDRPDDWGIESSEWAFNVEVAGPLHGTQWVPVLGEGWQTGLWYVSDFEGALTNFRRGAECFEEISPQERTEVQPCPANELNGTAASPHPNWQARAEELKQTRREHFMWGTDKNFYWAGRYWLFKLEQRFTFGDYLSNRQEAASTTALGIIDPQIKGTARNKNVIRNFRFKDGFKKTNLMATGVTISTKFLTDLDFSLLYIDQRRFNRPLESNVRRLNANTLLWSLRYPLEGTEDRLVPAVTTFVALTGPASWRQRIDLGYDLGENTKIYIDYNWFSGDSDSTYGGWDDWDQVRFGVTHKF